MFDRVGGWVRQHMRLLAYAGGVWFVGAWTVIRHWTNGVNFDVVGQVGVADQWARGLHDGAQLGATNYLLKMPVYWVVNQLDLLSPHGKLLLLALAFNVATFILILYLFERILHLYKITPSVWFYLTMVWLASISCRVYWLDYANSRNLETAGGIVVLYLGLVLLRRGATWKRLALLVSIGSVVFFADQLQIYAIAGGLTLYVALRWLIRRTAARAKQGAWIIGGLAGAVIGSKLLTALLTAVLPVSFLVAPRGSTLSLNTLADTVQGLLTNTGRVFDVSFYAASGGPNAVRELLNFVIAAVILALLVMAWHKRLFNGLSLACVCCIIAVYGAYIVSGQAALTITERYLIMAPLLTGLLVGSLGDVQIQYLRFIQTGWVGILCISAVLTAGALAVSWPERYSKDVYIGSILSFMQQQGADFAITSRDGIPATYFAEGSATVIPVICQPSRVVVASNLFYDQARFGDIARQTTLIPLIVPYSGINSSGSVCGIPDIERQFGYPLSARDVPGYGTALWYPSSQLKLHGWVD